MVESSKTHRGRFERRVEIELPFRLDGHDERFPCLFNRLCGHRLLSHGGGLSRLYELRHIHQG